MIKSWKMAGKNYRVRYAKDEFGNNLGQSRSPIGEVLLAKHWDGKELPDDSIEQTFFHELVHCILDEAGTRGEHDESFVQSFAVLLYEFFKTAKYTE